jgi:3-hydroxyacyl-CoA dehydrogenase
MLAARSFELERLLLEGAPPQQIDAAIVAFGFPMGPLAMADLCGLEIEWNIRKMRGEQADIADGLCGLARFGRKTGCGYYRYGTGDGKPQHDPDVERLIAEAASRRGIARRRIEDDEILQRLLFPVINEGARILDEGIAARAGDIDVIWVNGYGWPAWRGGPMYYADRLGLSHIRDRIELFARRSGDDRLRPAALLVRLADEGASLGEWRRQPAPGTEA